MLFSACEREKERTYLQYSLKDKHTRLSITYENSLAEHYASIVFFLLLCFSQQGILGDPLSALSSFLEPRPPRPPHLWFLSSPFVWRNASLTNTDGDKHGGMVRDRGLTGKPARYLLIQLQPIFLRWSELVSGGQGQAGGVKLVLLQDQNKRYTERKRCCNLKPYLLLDVDMNLLPIPH